MKTYVYIDGFNLYYGSLKGTAYKWLDPGALCRVMLKPENVVEKIHYFTARVISRADDPDQTNRQNTYLRALRTIPNLQIHYGHFLSHVVSMPVAFPAPHSPHFVKVIKTEEKGSDVNLATMLILDAWRAVFDCAVVISGDSDLKAPVKAVQEQFHKTVGVLNPQKIPCRELHSVARFYKQIRESALQLSQFPTVLTDAIGSFHKPSTW